MPEIDDETLETAPPPDEPVPGAGNEPPEQETPETELAPDEDDGPADLLNLDEPPAEEGEDDEPLIGKDGKILGKFKTVPALAKSYKEATSQMSRKATEAAEYRKLLEMNGFTFDADNKPVAPAAKPAEAPAPAVPVAAPDPNAEPPGFTDANGVEYDFLGMPVVSDDDWDELEESDPREYQRVRTQYDATRAVRREQWRQQQAQEQQKTQQAQFETAKQTIRKSAETDLGLEPELIDLIEAERDKLLLHVAPEYRNNPVALGYATDRAAAMVMPGYYKARMGQAVTGTAEAAQRAQKVVRTERGSSAAPPAPPPAKASGLTNEQKRFARELGVTEEQYAANL